MTALGRTAVRIASVRLVRTTAALLLAIAILSPPLALVVGALALVLSLAAVITLPAARRSQARLAAATRRMMECSGLGAGPVMRGT